MIRDAADTTAKGQELRTEICIIGAGAAGLAIAHDLIASGKSVIVLESSRYNDCTVVTGQQRHRFEDPAVQPIYAGTMVDPSAGKTADEFFNRARVRCYGGTTNAWEGWTRPLQGGDFMRHVRWPPEVQKDLRNTYFKRAMAYCSLDAWGVASYDNDKAQYDSWIEQARYQIDVIDPAKMADLETSIVVKMGEDASNGKRHDTALDFQLRWGPDIEQAPKVVLYRNANARQLVMSDKLFALGRVKATTVVRDDYNRPVAGHDFYVKADRFVLAASCIENTRLLLNSGFSTAKWKALGRYLMTHPRIGKAATFQMNAVPSVRVQTFFNRFTTIFGKQPNYQPGIRAMLSPTPTYYLRENIGNFRAMMFLNSAVGNDGSVDELVWEQYPNESNQIAQGTDKDLFGDPVAKVTLDLKPEDTRTHQVALQLLAAMLTKTGYGTNFQAAKDPLILLSGEDAMGATRMQPAGPDAGVVDANCAMHDVNNLYIAGSSVFPAGGWANPGLTVIALALRLADHLKGKFN